MDNLDVHIKREVVEDEEIIGANQGSKSEYQNIQLKEVNIKDEILENIKQEECDSSYIENKCENSEDPLNVEAASSLFLNIEYDDYKLFNNLQESLNSVEQCQSLILPTNNSKPDCYMRSNETTISGKDVKCHVVVEDFKDLQRKNHYSSYQSNDLKNDREDWGLGTGEKTFRCVECSYSSTNRSHMKTHSRIHTGEKPFKCPKCFFNCSDPSSFQRHLRKHTGERPYKCGKCGLTYRHANSLKKHSLVHARKKRYGCATCDYRTDNADHLKVHNRIHTGEKPFKCVKCKFNCSDPSSFKRHLRKHTDERPYECVKCGLTYKHSNSLKKHSRVHK